MEGKKDNEQRLNMMEEFSLHLWGKHLETAQDSMFLMGNYGNELCSTVR